MGLLSTRGKGNQREGGGCNWSVHWEKASQCGAPTNRTCIGGVASGEFCSGDGCEQRKNSATHQLWRGEGDWSATEKKQPEKKRVVRKQSEGGRGLTPGVSQWHCCGVEECRTPSGNGKKVTCKGERNKLWGGKERCNGKTQPRMRK